METLNDVIDYSPYFSGKDEPPPFYHETFDLSDKLFIPVDDFSLGEKLCDKPKEKMVLHHFVYDSAQNRLLRNNFSDGIVSRKTASPDNLYRQVQNALPEVNRGTIYTVSDALVSQTLDLLSKGYAVNFFGLGTFRIAACGTTDSRTGKIPLTVKFTPSEQTKLAVQNVQVAETVCADYVGNISSITDIKTGSTDFTLTAGGAVLIKGSRLKIAGEGSGVWLVPLSDAGNITEDEGKWIKVDSAFAYNTSGRLMFTLPASLAAGTKYRFVLRTHCPAGHMIKRMVETVSGIVTIGGGGEN
ncbi:MAG: DUF4469 domain-containing protein [Treponema sp.]|nr:DUF4469 domain-containing protein [Spirochaetia bacterium]MDD7460626.1 DUF4469 domain-containing protein [Spirochaetales bacterium]MDY5811138.1 DUF4469 domain-containing protein [Treponema sp.]MEE1182385.1 DUF4469 domain-containing protein [Treponema sp.]